jgi:hypothetical protein
MFSEQGADRRFYEQRISFLALEGLAQVMKWKFKHLIWDHI